MTRILRNLNRVFRFVLSFSVLLMMVSEARAQQCSSTDGVVLQVLGSGGPIADDARASSSYLLWQDGRARVVVDLGAGALLRFAESGARFEDLDAILLSHLHADHSADLPAFLKSGYFAHRQRELLIAGPGAGGNQRVHFPALDEYLEAMFAADTGAYGYLSGYLDGNDGSPKLVPRVIGEDGERTVHSVLEVDGLRVTASRVAHGPVPAVAYRTAVGDKVVVFAGDQDGRGDLLSNFAKGADMLVLHMPIPQGAAAAAKALHAEPARLGAQAARADADTILLSHFMARSLRNLKGNLDALEREYKGEVLLAEDLLCVPL